MGSFELTSCGSVMVEIPPPLAAAIEQLTPLARNSLLWALDSPDDVRLVWIRRLHNRDDMRAVAELLIDLESDPSARWLVIEALRRGQTTH